MTGELVSKPKPNNIISKPKYHDAATSRLKECGMLTLRLWTREQIRISNRARICLSKARPPPKATPSMTHLWQTDFSSSHKCTTSCCGENSFPREIDVKDISFLLIKSQWQNKVPPEEPESIRLAYRVWVRE